MDILNEDWWRDAVEVDLRNSVNLEEADWWTSGFLPPPPRPPFLEEVTSDGLTTCDLCTWARHPHYATELAGGREVSWVMTLIIVSLLSAFIGAVVMITYIRCRKLKHLGHNASSCWCLSRDTEQDVPTIHLAARPASRSSSKAQESRCTMGTGEVGDARRKRVWTWLSRRADAAPAQLGAPAPPVADNHYTEAYPPNGEALYAELDRESNSSPAYQNTGYSGSEMEQDCVPSSAPSSAYYSDLSVAPSDRTYEAVGPPDPSWDPRRLTAIAETLSHPPDNWETPRLPPLRRTLADQLTEATLEARRHHHLHRPPPPYSPRTVPSDYV